MALDQFELLAAKKILIPSCATLLIEARAEGATDPRARVKAWFADPVRRAVMSARFGWTEGGLTQDDWDAAVDAAYAQI